MSDPRARATWIVIESDSLFEMLHRCHAGEPPDLVMLEYSANDDLANVTSTPRCAQHIAVAIELVIVLLAAFAVWALLTP